MPKIKTPDDQDILLYARTRIANELARGKSYQGLARATGIPFCTLRYIAIGQIESPRYSTLVKLVNGLKALDKEPASA